MKTKKMKKKLVKIKFETPGYSMQISLGGTCTDAVNYDISNSYTVLHEEIPTRENEANSRSYADTRPRHSPDITGLLQTAYPTVCLGSTFPR